MKVLAVLVIGVIAFVQWVGFEFKLPSLPAKKPTVRRIIAEWAVIYPENVDGQNVCQVDMPAEFEQQFRTADEFFREYWWSTCKIDGYGTVKLGVHPELKRTQEFQNFMDSYPWRFKPVQPHRNRHNVMVRASPDDPDVFAVWLNGANKGPGKPFSTLNTIPRLLQPNETVRLTIMEPGMIHDLHRNDTPFRLGYPPTWVTPNMLRFYPCRTRDQHYMLALCVRLRTESGKVSPEAPYWRKFCNWVGAPVPREGHYVVQAYLHQKALPCGNVLELRNSFYEPSSEQAGIEFLFNSPLSERTYFTRTPTAAYQNMGYVYGLGGTGVWILIESLGTPRSS